jgi:FKBP-type peptidyl-prolyl cis-trans isomerase
LCSTEISLENGKFKDWGGIVKGKILCGVLLSVSFVVAQEKQSGADTTKLSNYQDSISYILGRDVGSQLKKFDTRIQMNSFVQGMEQALAGAKSVIDSTKADSIRQSFALKVQEKVMKDEQVLAEKNKKASDDFLAKNKKAKGIKTTKSGLQYEVLEKGKGPKPTATDSVLVSYKGMFLDSTVFDSTSGSQPVPLNLQRTIPGLAEGVQLMREGARYRFFVPPELGYGSQGAPPVVPPNSLLIFDVTLSKVPEKIK